MSRDRDRILEQALTHELRAAGRLDRDACVDAETLGAWADGGLDAAQMAAVELHASTCARCQAIVGAMARSAPLPAGARAAGPFFSWRWWLAPLASAAAAVTLWMVVPEKRDIVLPPPSVAAPPSAPVATVAPSQSKDQAVPIESAPARLAEERSALADRAQRRERFADASEKKEAGLAAKKPDERAVTPLPAANAMADAAAGAPAAVPAPAATRPSAAPAQELRKSARLSFAPIEIVSPDPSRRWRVVNGAVERSEDGGASWTAVRPADGESITGGTAPAGAICWLIGSSGLVLVTADGITFARVPLPERVDLTAVTATDARTAVVTTADGRRFSTGDAGRTWREN